MLCPHVHDDLIVYVFRFSSYFPIDYDIPTMVFKQNSNVKLGGYALTKHDINEMNRMYCSKGPSKTTTGKPTTTSKKEPTVKKTTSEDCEDYNAICPQLKGHALCKTSEWLKKCPKTCGNCQVTKTTETKTTETKTTKKTTTKSQCGDKLDYCVNINDRHNFHCKIPYYRDNCPASCETCTPGETGSSKTTAQPKTTRETTTPTKATKRKTTQTKAATTPTKATKRKTTQTKAATTPTKATKKITTQTKTTKKESTSTVNEGKNI